MSDRDETTGQFAAPEPQAFGLESVERAAGHVPYVEENDDSNAELTVEEAAQQLPTTAEADVKTYSPFDSMDEGVYLTEAQAAKAIDDISRAESEQAELEQNDKVRKEVDELRGDKPESEKVEEAATPEQDVAKLLELPHVKEAVEKITGEAQQARSQYQAGLNEAATIAQAAFTTQFPELANAPPEQHAAIMSQLQQTDPARYAQLESMVLNTAAIWQAGQAEQQRVETEKQAKLQDYVKAEVARFESIVKDISKADREEIEAGIVEAIEEYGGKTEEFVKLMKGSEFSNATVLALLYDVGRYRQIIKAPKAVASKELPKVQRPGSPAPRGSANSETLASLQKQLDGAKTEGQQLRIGRKILELQSATRRAS